MKTWINVLLAHTTLLLAAMLLGSMFGGARAQNFPHKPVKIVVAASPGTSLDILSRLVGNELSSRLGQMFVVENMPGAGGNIATVNVANAPADGYTLLMQISSFAINPSLYKKVPYDPIKQGLIADSSTPEAFAEIIKTDLAYWSKMIKQTGITVD